MNKIKNNIKMLLIIILNLSIWMIGYILTFVNIIVIIFTEKENFEPKIIYGINSNKLSSTGKLRKLLKYMQFYAKKSTRISVKNLEFSFFDTFSKIESDNNEEILIVLPNMKNTVSVVFLNYRIIKKLIKTKNVKIAINSQTKYMFWTTLFSHYLINIKTTQFSKYKAVIYLNSPTDHYLDIMNIPNLALLAKRFYCFFSKYISDNFPWINVCCDYNDILSKMKFSIAINNFGYDEFLNLKNINGLTKDFPLMFVEEFMRNFNLLKSKKAENIGNDLCIAVIFPIHNNGLYLKCRSFKSCLFNANFYDNKIFLIDDGSQSETKDYINFIKNEFHNVITHEIPGNGSGSPSKPRNIGINMAIESKCDYISFLDPDNHFLPFSLDTMLSNICSRKCDICAYNMWTFGRNYDRRNREIVIKYNQILNSFHSKSYLSTLEHFKFKCFNMQQIIINADWFSKNLVYEYEDSLGEDVIFWYELVMKNPSISFFDVTNSIYFNFQKNSLTNSINASFFSKSIIGYNHLFDVLSKNSLISQYLKYEFYNNFYEGVMIHWNSNFGKNLFNQLINTFKIFDSENKCIDQNNIYRKKCIELLK